MIVWMIMSDIISIGLDDDPERDSPIMFEQSSSNNSGKLEGNVGSVKDLVKKFQVLRSSRNATP